MARLRGVEAAGAGVGTREEAGDGLMSVSTGRTSIPGTLSLGGSFSRYRGRTCSCSESSAYSSPRMPFFRMVHTWREGGREGGREGKVE